MDCPQSRPGTGVRFHRNSPGKVDRQGTDDLFSCRCVPPHHLNLQYPISLGGTTPPLKTNLNLSLKPRSQKYLSQLHPRSSTSENKILVLDATTSPLQIWTRTCRGPLHRKTKYLELKLELELHTRSSTSEKQNTCLMLSTPLTNLT